MSASSASGHALQAQLVSAPFASGIAWLVNVLLELDLRATYGGFQPDHWIPDEAGERIGERAYQHLRWHLPILHEKTEFAFDPGLEVFWDHRLDFARHGGRPTILYVRDPRDAIYSLYCRYAIHTLSLTDYLARPDGWPDHFPGVFNLPPAETWAYFHHFWLAMREVTPLLIVRFEDMRARPVAETQRVLAFLGVEREAADIARALERSTFERHRAAMRRMEQETGETFLTARRGKVGEWREVYDEAALSCFAGPAQAVMRELGYEAPDLLPGRTTTLSFVQMAAGASPGAQSVLAGALTALKGGFAEQAEQMLEQALSEFSSNMVDRLALANARTAACWTRNVFTQEAMATPAALSALTAFLDANARFLATPSVYENLLQVGRETSDAARASLANAVGEALYQVQQPESARATFLHGLALAPTSATLLNNLAVLHWNLQERECALSYIRQAWSADPANPQVVENDQAMRAKGMHV